LTQLRVGGHVAHATPLPNTKTAIPAQILASIGAPLPTLKAGLYPKSPTTTR
jgi:hypothetical protein